MAYPSLHSNKIEEVTCVLATLRSRSKGDVKAEYHLGERLAKQEVMVREMRRNE